MRVHGNALTPTTRMVLNCVAEKGHTAELVHVELSRGEQRTPEHLARHPFGLTPVLEDDAGYHYEARAIVRYLDRALTGPALTPTDVRGFGRMERFIAVEQSYYSPAIMQHFYARFLGRDPGPAALEAARSAAARALEVVEAALADGPFLAGERFTLADLVWQPYLAITERTGNGDLLRSPRVADWWARLGEREAARSTAA